MKKMLRSIAAVIAGFLACALLSVATDALLEHAGVFPSLDHPELYGAGLLLLATAYRALFTVLGGYVTGWLAPAKPLAHGLALGVLGTLAGTAGAIANWSKAAGNEWYPIALIVMGIPACCLGAWLYVKIRR